MISLRNQKFLLLLSLFCLSFMFKISEAEPRTIEEEKDTEESNNIISGHRRPILKPDHSPEGPNSSKEDNKENAGNRVPAAGSYRDKDGDGVKVGKHGEDNDNDPGSAVADDGDNDIATKISSSYGKSGEFVHGFIATLSVIIVSELGDKTFFIAAIMAMKHSRLTIFISAMAALSIMHVMSSFFGYATTVIPRVYTFYLSSFLFAVFGIKMLREGWKMSPNEAQEEFDEVQEDLRKRETQDIEAGGSAGTKNVSVFSFVSKIFIQAFTMTFLAEWGDRSQLATIVLAAREEIKSVIIGGILGHSICTGLAVIGGRFIAQRISVRTVTMVGGVVFLIFAMTAFFMDPTES